ncbi:pyrimidine/purine nucleoside phosphorylase [bacterium]|nr:pyrimidine/purine nucleoside phosphorylase [bacterium]MDA7518531.1 pyrimidine/purine nucleoside phosphorylase [Akkermansiaceae bacterium]MDA7877019.1 pyrimidine/purine nucleoside phosphorylase [Akkermansiaceae bacterium]MDA7917056.1 pyrimidine/purine nucleoside phosphorylase [Akkermansiaceae bacterium]MDA8876213.1 pyrimidine/purine nucleoside phosphorylase [Akkermansiaceae bacterium]
MRDFSAMQFENVTALAEGNVYFDGKVISHTILLADGARKTLGVILPGSYHFGTEAAERMEIVGGACSYVLDGSEESQEAPKGESFEVPANSGFTISVKEECHYVCSFL